MAVLAHQGSGKAVRRKSSKRDIVLQVLTDIGRPLSPQEILVAAQGEAPTLGIATVYRNIRQLQDDGLIQPVELPGLALRYELAGKHHHHHFHCNGCGRVYEIEGCPFGEHPHANLPEGFEIEDHSVVVYGHCAECSRG